VKALSVAATKQQRAGDESGIALIVALMAMSFLLALGLALALTTATESRIAGNYRETVEALYAADSAVERAIQDLVSASDWDSVLNGATTSSFIDGSPFGIRVLPDGSAFDLTRATNIVRCDKSTCSQADLIAISEERPWGANNPVWQPYAFGPVADLVSGTIDSLMYVVVWVADDPSENDNDPLRDGAPPAACDIDKDPSCADDNIGRGIVTMKAQAMGPGGTQRSIEVTLARAARGGVRIVSWQEVR
jgi:Tfp pilus assembly protein PilX